MKLEQLVLFFQDGLNRYWYFKYNQELKYDQVRRLLPVYHNNRGIEVRYEK